MREVTWYDFYTGACDLLADMMQKKETIYGAEKLAKFFGVTVKTARGWCKRGKLPAFKIGKEWKVRVIDLQRMIDRKVRVYDDNKPPRLF